MKGLISIICFVNYIILVYSFNSISDYRPILCLERVWGISNLRKQKHIASKAEKDRLFGNTEEL